MAHTSPVIWFWFSSHSTWHSCWAWLVCYFVERRQKSRRDTSGDTARSCIGLFWKSTSLRLANAWDRQEHWDKCLFDLVSPIHPGFFTALCSQNSKAANQCSVTPVNWAVWEKGSTSRRNHTYLLLWTLLSFSLSLHTGAPSTLLWARAALFSFYFPRISRRGHKCFMWLSCL